MTSIYKKQRAAEIRDHAFHDAIFSRVNRYLISLCKKNLLQSKISRIKLNFSKICSGSNPGQSK